MRVGGGGGVCERAHSFTSKPYHVTPIFTTCFRCLSPQFNLAIPLIFLAVVLFLLIMPLYAAPTDTGMGLLCVLTGIPVYLICVKWKNKPRVFEQYVSEYASSLFVGTCSECVW